MKIAACSFLLQNYLWIQKQLDHWNIMRLYFQS